MDRRERIEKERELSKREERFRKQEEKLKQEAAPSQSFLERVGQAIPGKTIWFIGAVLSLLGGYAVARPRVPLNHPFR